MQLFDEMSNQAHVSTNNNFEGIIGQYAALFVDTTTNKIPKDKISPAEKFASFRQKLDELGATERQLNKAFSQGSDLRTARNYLIVLKELWDTFRDEHSLYLLYANTNEGKMTDIAKDRLPIVKSNIEYVVEMENKVGEYIKDYVTNKIEFSIEIAEKYDEKILNNFKAELIKAAIIAVRYTNGDLLACMIDKTISRKDFKFVIDRDTNNMDFSDTVLYLQTSTEKRFIKQFEKQKNLEDLLEQELGLMHSALEEREARADYRISSSCTLF